MFNCAAVALIAAVSLARVSTSLPLGRVINYRRGSAIGDGDVAFDSYPFKRALVVAAHPDDIETICGGVVAQFVDQGIDVAYVITTNGDKGWSKGFNMTSPLLATIREAEQLAAAQALNVSNVTFLRQEDGRLEGADPIVLKLNVTTAIRQWQPDVVLSFSFETDYSQYAFGLMHRDHQTTGRAAIDSVWPACRDYLDYESQLYDVGILPWIVPQIWLFNFGQVTATDILVNITGYWLERKYAALLEHHSQYTNASEVLGELVAIGSAIASKNGLDPTTTLVEAYQVVNML